MAAGVLAWAVGLCFGLPASLGSGMPLLVALLLACAAELLAGRLLWNRLRSGAIFALALLPVQVAFWIGFALPAGPAAGLARTV
ncbi:MAG TPA: hypothetical protein VJT16_11890, partial [Streptosporangiaceae bacterium]|nr:hypothetical protein [Streptosporangiaceae bacterium]